MQCPSCYNDSLSATDDGKLVCDECGEEFAGYREEEVDMLLAGTAVSNRESQSSQARNVRKKIAIKSSASLYSEPSSNTLLKDDTKLCEAAFILARSIAERLISLRFVHRRIKRPLFELLTHWAGRQHRGLPGIRFRYRAFFRPNHVLSLICLAAVYVRSPMLPRDLVRLIATRQVPYLDAWKMLPEELNSIPRIREVFTPLVMPTVFQICEPANIFARDVSAWPPIREFFKSTAFRDMAFVKQYCAFSAFPVGHFHLTLLRITRLLGLPDDFGARVLRFRELRMIAVKMARVVHGKRTGPWENSRVDEYNLSEFESIADAMKKRLSCPPNGLDLYSFPTDESLQLDFINTMRLCYGRTSNRAKVAGLVDAEKEASLQEEWNSCVGAMETWLKLGNPEDVDSVVWSCMPPDVIADLNGPGLRQFSALVEDVLKGIGDDVPELWGRFTSEFDRIGESDAVTAYRGTDDAGGSRRKCQYDVSRFLDGWLLDARQGSLEMQEEAEHIRGTQQTALRKTHQLGKTVRGSKRRRANAAKKTRKDTHRNSRRGHERDSLRDQINSRNVPISQSTKSRSMEEVELIFSSDDETEDNKGINNAIQRKKTVTFKRQPERITVADHAEPDILDYRGQCQVPPHSASSDVEDGGPAILTQALMREPRKSSSLNSSDEDRIEPAISDRVSKQVDPVARDGSSRISRGTPLKEPKGIGLAWSIIRCFFAGSNVSVSGIDHLHTLASERQRLAKQLNWSMRSVIEYLTAINESNAAGQGMS